MTGEEATVEPRRAAPRWRTRVVARLLNLPTRLPRVERLLVRLHASAYRRSRGAVLGRWIGAPVMLIETVGRRTGAIRRVPIVYVRDGEAFVVVAANAGSRHTPAWWLNLEAAGAGTVILGDRRLPVRPRVTQGEERERLWARCAETIPSIEAYRTYTERELPVVVLESAPTA